MKSTIEYFQLNEVEYENKFNEKVPEVVTTVPSGPTGGRGKDTLTSQNTLIRSTSWLNGVVWAYNQLSDFTSDNPEFGNFDWSVATLDDIDVFMGYFWLWHAPQEGGSSLGKTRFTVETLKQIRTKIQNVINHMLKRKDVNLSSQAMTFSNNMYISKRNSTAVEPMVGNAGDRKRVALTKEDREKLDEWMTSSLETVSAHHLQLKAGTIILETTCARGTDFLRQIRRSYVSVQLDAKGCKVLKIRGNVRTKTKQGRSADYKPLNHCITTEEEVACIEKLLFHLPEVGCQWCTGHNPPKLIAQDQKCACEDLFLKPLDENKKTVWVKTQKTWYCRQRRGDSWFKQMMKKVSSAADLSKVYNNGSMRPTVVTELLASGLGNRQVMEFSGHKSGAMVQHYSRKLEQMTDDEKKKAAELLTSSGRMKQRKKDSEKTEKTLSGSPEF